MTSLFSLLVLFIKADFNKKPVVLVPGLYGSNLYVSYDEKAKVPWYCPKKADNELLWIRTKLAFPPFVNCIAYLTQNKFNNETQKLENNPGVNITVEDFGRHTSVDYIVKNQAKFRDYDVKDKKGKLEFYDNFGSYIKHFINNGYKIGKDFFVAPYDWRLAPLFVDDFWTRFRKLIEEAYDKSKGKKVTLAGFSMGCFMIQQFLASKQLIRKTKGRKIDGRPLWTSIKDPQIAVSERWINKYIEKVVFLAPSFGGSLKVFDGMLRRFSPLIPFYRTEYIADMSTSIPGFYSHWPNLEIFKGLNVVKGPDGRNYTIEQLRDLVFNYSNIKPEYVPIMDISIDLQRKAPIDIGENIPLTIIYNSKVPTASFLDYKKGWDHDPVRYFNGSGDGTVPSRGIRYACDNWKTHKRHLICIDLEKDDANNFEHGALSSNPFVLNMIYNAVNGNPVKGKDQWWTKTGKTDIHLEHENIVF